MKYTVNLFSLTFSAFFYFLFPEKPIIIKKTEINYKDYPIKQYVDSITSKNEVLHKKAFDYIDSIYLFHIIYKSDSLNICGYISMPKKHGSYPCIIYNRGGNKDLNNLKVADVVTTMGKIASAGYVVIASTYRGNSCSKGNDEFGGADVNDVLNLMNALGEIPYADTSRIGMYGFSRGGMMTYLCLTKTNRIKAAVTVGAPSDLAELAANRTDMEIVYKELIPNYALNKQLELDKRSAIKWPCNFPKTCPILLLHGESDIRVPLSQAKKLSIQFSKCKIPHKLIIFDEDDHSLSFHQNEASELIINWFDKYLR